MEKQLKQDMNFLEYPLWFQNSRMAKLQDEGYVWRDRKGFVFRTSYNPPTRTDYIFLCYLLLKCQESGWKEEIELSRYEVLQACGLNKGLKNYKRLQNSLKRWNMVGLEFRGIFYDGVEYQIMQFGVIDDWDIEKETKRLRVRFNPKWLLCIKQSQFFQFIKFEDIKNLNSPLALRLYEILIEAFQGRDTWQIDALKLAAKIPMAQKYPSDILPKVKIAIDRINEHTSIKISMTVRQPERGKATIVFHKEKKKVNAEKPSPVLIPEELISLVSMDAVHDCPNNTSYSTGSRLCESFPICEAGTYDAGLNTCYEGDNTCPYGTQYACMSYQGKNQCSAQECMQYGDSTETKGLPEGSNDKQDDGQYSENGECLGQIYVFNGNDRRCRSGGLTIGFENCCQDEDYLFGLGLCKQEEIQLAKLKGRGLCHEIGEYCSKKIKLGFTKICIEHTKSYCCFNSKLSRIVHEQGRPQMKTDINNWGAAEGPHCRGFIPEEFQRLDFSTIDLSQWYGDIVPTSQEQVENNMQQSIQRFYDKLD